MGALGIKMAATTRTIGKISIGILYKKAPKSKRRHACCQARFMQLSVRVSGKKTVVQGDRGTWEAQTLGGLKNSAPNSCFTTPKQNSYL